MSAVCTNLYWNRIEVDSRTEELSFQPGQRFAPSTSFVVASVKEPGGLKREFEKCLKKIFTFGMSMSMLWSAQYLKMSESIVTPVLENKISIDTDPFVKKYSNRSSNRPSNASTAVNQHRGVPVLPGGNLDNYVYDQRPATWRQKFLLLSRFTSETVCLRRADSSSMNVRYSPTFNFVWFSIS